MEYFLGQHNPLDYFALTKMECMGRGCLGRCKETRKSEREMTTPLFLLRCVQLGISIADLDLLTIGLVNDRFTER